MFYFIPFFHFIKCSKITHNMYTQFTEMLW